MWSRRRRLRISVAADKGTATFSDIANEVAASQLLAGDAFASAVRSATTTRRWASPPRAHGRRRATSESGVDTHRGLQCGRRRRHERRRVRQRHCSLSKHIRLLSRSTIGTSSSTPSDAAMIPKRAQSTLQPPQSSWRTTTIADQRGRRVYRPRTSHPDQPTGASQLGIMENIEEMTRRSDQAIPKAPPTCCSTAASAPTSRRRRSRTPMLVTAPTIRCASTETRCAPT
jgi:glutamate dehydrogenase